MNDKPTLAELPGLLASELDRIDPKLNSASRAIVCGILDDAVARAEAAEARALTEHQTASDLLAVVARIGEQLSIPDSAPDLCNTVEAEVKHLRDHVAELETDRDVWRVAHADNELYGLELIAQRDAALARVAELEAALDAERDAHAWRPVSDDAPAPLEKVVVATRDDPDVAWRLPEVPHLWNTRRGRSLLTQEIAGYLPLPPQEPTQ